MTGVASPETLSPLLATLFPPGAVCAELWGSGNPESLLPAEGQHLGKAVSSRREEFAAGRACARLALGEFGIVDFALQAGEDRRPRWPDGMKGSITHTRGFCAAVVARSKTLRAVGIDTERIGSVKPELWPRICGPETGWLETIREEWRPVAATLIFCVKEAFYKCQYEITAEYLGFNDARVEFDAWNANAGSFAVHACRPMALAGHVPLPLAGRYLVHREFVTAGIAVAQ